MGKVERVLLGGAEIWFCLLRDFESGNILMMGGGSTLSATVASLALTLG